MRRKILKLLTCWNIVHLCPDKKVIFAVADGDLKEGEEKLAIVLERQLSYFSNLESLDGLFQHLGDSPWTQIFTVIAEGFDKEHPRAPFAL